MGLFDTIKKAANDAANTIKDEAVKEFKDSDFAKDFGGLAKGIGDAIGKGKQDKIEDTYKTGGAYSFEVDLPVASNYVNEGNWHDAYFYIGSDEEMELMRNRYEPHMKYDWEEKRNIWNEYFKNKIVQKFFYKYKLSQSTYKTELDYSYADKEVKFFRSMVDQLESFKPVPDKFVVNGEFDKNAYEAESETIYYNPFVNFIMNHGNFDLSIKDLCALNNLFADQIIDESDLLGLDNEKLLYDPQLYANHDSNRIIEIVLNIKEKQGYDAEKINEARKHIQG